jgi:hypothetical protein
MAYMPTPVKSAVTEFSKSFPDIAIAEEIDFEMWGHKFIVAIISRFFALKLMNPNLRFIE